MAAETKAALIAITAKEFAKLDQLIVSLDADFAMEKRDDDTSIKDIIAHRAHWIDLFLGSGPINSAPSVPQIFSVTRHICAGIVVLFQADVTQLTSHYRSAAKYMRSIIKSA